MDTKNLKVCSGCKKVKYCCRDCQRADWKNHKNTCQQKKKPVGGAMIRAPADEFAYAMAIDRATLLIRRGRDLARQGQAEKKHAEHPHYINARALFQQAKTLIEHPAIDAAHRCPDWSRLWAFLHYQLGVLAQIQLDTHGFNGLSDHRPPAPGDSLGPNELDDAIDAVCVAESNYTLHFGDPQHSHVQDTVIVRVNLEKVKQNMCTPWWQASKEVEATAGCCGEGYRAHVRTLRHLPGAKGTKGARGKGEGNKELMLELTRDSPSDWRTSKIPFSLWLTGLWVRTEQVYMDVFEEAYGSNCVEPYPPLEYIHKCVVCRRSAVSDFRVALYCYEYVTVENRHLSRILGQINSSNRLVPRLICPRCCEKLPTSKGRDDKNSERWHPSDVLNVQRLRTHGHRCMSIVEALVCGQRFSLLEDRIYHTKAKLRAKAQGCIVVPSRDESVEGGVSNLLMKFPRMMKCVFCSKSGSDDAPLKLKLCAGCKKGKNGHFLTPPELASRAWYCSDECQINDWKDHKKVCLSKH